METIHVINDGDVQTIRLPRSVHLSSNKVIVRQVGESVVLEPARPEDWPDGFFEAIHIDDPAFARPLQGQLPPIKGV